MCPTQPPARPRLALAALAVGVVAIAFAAIFFRLAAPTSPAVAAATRLALAGALMMPFTVRGWRRGRLPPVVLRGALICGLCYGLHFGAWVTSLSLTSVAASVTLVTATPLILGLVGRWTGQDAPTPRLWLAIGAAAVGTLIIGGADLALDGEALIGDALALLGAVAMVGYLICARRIGQRLAEAGAPPLDVLAFAGITTTVGALCLAAFTGLRALGGHGPIWPDMEALGWLALGALIPQIVGHNLLTWALRRTTPTVVGLSTVGEPVISTALGWLWLRESVSVEIAAGCLVVLAGITLGVSRPRKPA